MPQDTLGRLGQEGETQSSLAPKLWAFTKHPVTTLTVGVLVALSIYFLSKSVKRPIYSVSPVELIAQRLPGEQSLTLLWNSQPIENAASVTVAVWNDGSQYIDKRDISTDDPIAIRPPEGVHVLAVTLVRSSRHNLKFDWSIRADERGREAVLLTISGDEALEQFDGALFHILFAGNTHSQWYLTGRIKGVPEGFRRKDWDRVHRHSESKFTTYSVGIVSPILLVAAVLIVSLRSMRRMKKSQTAKARADILVPLILLWGSAIFMIYQGIHEVAFLGAPPWLNM